MRGLNPNLIKQNRFVVFVERAVYECVALEIASIFRRSIWPSGGNGSFSYEFTFADPPIPTVDVNLGSLPSRDLSGCIDGFALRFIAARHTFCTPFADCPLSVPWHDVLTVASHGGCPLFACEPV